MATKYTKTRIAAAVCAAALGAGLTAPAGAVVVVGGDNGWEVSFDGNVNAFYTVGNYDKGYVAESHDTHNSRITSGFLPAFFSFNVKSPTIDGMTGSARISFAPVIQTGGAKTQLGAATNGAPGIQGAQIDTREVVANLSGGFGEVSFGRTLSLFGRNAILNDMTLFGVGFVPGGDQFGSVTFGRSGNGYTYPDFAARFQYTTPVVSGFQAAFGIYDPSNVAGLTARGVSGSGIGGLLDKTDKPRFEGEISYSTAFTGGNFKTWMDGLWQDIDSTCQGNSLVKISAVIGAPTAQCGSMRTQAWGVGTKVGYQGFEVVGYYHRDEGLGEATQFVGDGVWFDSQGNLHERKGQGYYVQGTYTFAGKTKVGVSYGEGNLDSINGFTDANGVTHAFAGGGVTTHHMERSLWTVGVYHDVSSWLRLIAEYNRGELNNNDGAHAPQANTFSVGSFLFW